MDFEGIEYLKEGNSRQKQAYRILNTHSVFQSLEAYAPILTGTVPIGIDVPGSDLDIICHWKDEKDFERDLKFNFKDKQYFSLSKKHIGNRLSIICSFQTDAFKIEIFGQNIPCRSQNAYRHMIIEDRLLKKYGQGFKSKIIELKKKGFKTEPAFARLLGLNGDPYPELLKLGEQNQNNA